MYPFTSDDGFSVVDYKAINPELGTWNDVAQLSEHYGLMFDAVINHISRSSRWFQGYLRGEEPYTQYFHTCNPDEDYRKVIRPRALPLLTEVETVHGTQYVWTTFSDDQIDLNFACPRLLIEILEILIMYARNGADFIRLDAIGFLWKESGTSCMHLSKTHEAVKLMKAVLNVYAPGTKLITETNVPHKDNISYFGNGTDEADLVYQFPLPPLVMFSIQKGLATVLAKWMETLILPGNQVTFFNFLSSHDGIGLRPAEDILTAEEREFLVQCTLKNGGKVSYKDNGDNTKSPYELNINYMDALTSPDETDEVRIEKFLAAETILLSIQGVPGIYIHSLLGSRNNYYGMETSGISRRINREQLDVEYLENQLDTDTNRRRIFFELIRRLNNRKGETSFSPTADQRVMIHDPRVLSFIRENQETKEEIWVFINVSGENVNLKISDLSGRNLLKEEAIKETISLTPYEAKWIKTKESEEKK